MKLAHTRLYTYNVLRAPCTVYAEL